MTTQQRWKYLIGGLVGVLFLAFLVYRMLLAPLAELNAEFSKASDEAEAKEKEWLAFTREKKNQQHKRLLSLPLNVDEGVSNYYKYLRNIFEGTGLASKETVDITAPREADMRTQANAKKGQASHIVRTYQVKAHVTWPRLLAFLTKFQETPFLQRIKSFSVEKASGSADAGLLNVAMAIETLTFARPNQKGQPGKYDPKGRPDNLWGVNAGIVAIDALAGLEHAPAGWAMLLRAQALLLPRTPELRRYSDLSQRNPFLGMEPPAAVVKKEFKEKRNDGGGKSDKSDGVKVTGLDVLRYVKFEQYSGVEQDDVEKRKASLRNQLKPIAAGKDADLTLTANSSFEILDEDDRKPLVKGKVLRIDQRDVYFQVGESVYCIHADESMWDAMWETGPRGRPTPKALSRAQLEAIGLKKIPEPVEKSK